MIIKPYTRFDAAEIRLLYQAVGWSNYVTRQEMMEKAFALSLCTLGAYEENKLIGLIRCVGDGHSVVLIQDILVLPEYQRRGVGTALMGAVLDRYKHVYQIQLVTDNTEKTKAFYHAQGFRLLEEMGCCAFMKI